MADERTSAKPWLLRLIDRCDPHSLSTQLFLVTAVLMVAAFILMSVSLSSLKASQVQGEATEDTLLEITTIEARLLDSDRLLSGYVISGNAWYAGRFEKATRELHAATKKLGRSIGGDPVMSRMYRVIVDRIAKRQAVFDYLAHPSHHGEVARIERSAAARAERKLTGEIRDKIWKILQTEREKRVAHHTEMIDETQKSLMIAAGIMVLTLVSWMFNLLLTRVAVKRSLETRESRRAPA